MKIEDLIEKYGSLFKAMRELKLSQSTPNYWRKIGYIPSATQLRIENLTNGALRADWDDCRS